MKTMKNLSKRGFALFLALVMCVSMLQVTAFAEDTDTAGSEVTSSETEASAGGDAAETSDASSGEESSDSQGSADASDAGSSEGSDTQDSSDASDAGSSEGSDTQDSSNASDAESSEDGDAQDSSDASDAEGSEDGDAQDSSDASDAEGSEDGDAQDPADASDAEGSEDGDAQDPADASDAEGSEDGDAQDPADTPDAEGSEDGDAQDPADASDAEGSEDGDAQDPADTPDAEGSEDGDAQDPAETPDPADPEAVPPEEEPVQEIEAPKLPEEVLAPVIDAVHELLVQTFLSAAAALPETVSEENFEEVSALMDACMEAYDALSPEDWEREDVAAAMARMTGLMGEVETLALVFPTEPVAVIGDVEYLMLALAVRQAAPGDVITLIADVTESVTVSKDVTIDLNGHTWTGSGNTTLTISAANVTVQNGSMTSDVGYRAIEASATSDVKVTDVTFTTSGDISKETKVALDGVNPRQVGGVIYVENGDLTVTDCTFTGTAGGNNAYGTHIAISPRSKAVHPTVNLTISGSTFTGADSLYGAVHVAVDNSVTGRGANVNISGSTFTENNRSLYLSVGNLSSKPVFGVSVTGCTFEKNTNTGIYVNNNDKNGANVANFTLNVNDSKFLDNTGSAVGMSSASSRVTVNISGGEISGNVLGSGSVIQAYGPFTMDGTKVSGNTAYLVMDLEYADKVTIKNATISGNESTNSSDARGAIYIVPNDNATVDVSDSQFTGNSGRMGGALYIGGTNLTANITNCTISDNTAKNQGGGIYLKNTGTTTISNTTITGNTANGSSTKTLGFGNYGGGLYVANTTGTVALTNGTRIYNNHTPNDKQVPGTNDGGTADIALYSTTLTSKDQLAVRKNPDSYTRAELALGGDTSFKGDNGTTYTLTQFDRTLVNQTGYYYTSGSYYYWPMGYYTVTEEPVRVYLGTAEQHSGDKALVAADLAGAVALAEANHQDTIYVCGNVDVATEADVTALNSGITFARCSEHPNDHMFTINGDVTLDGAHIDGKSVAGNAAMIYVPSGGHLTIEDGTVIENGKNMSGDGGAICVLQGDLTMTGGIIQNNYAEGSGRVGGGGAIYAYSGVNLVFEGGRIQNNRTSSTQYGGGLLVGFGNVDIGVKGGRTVFEGNVSGMGGGIYFINSDSKYHYRVYAGDFLNNEAVTTNQNYEYYPGGGIYVSQGATVEMKNVFATNNTNTRSSGMAAVSMCPTGNVAIYEVDGALIVNNKTNTSWEKAADIGFNSHGNTQAYVSENALGGGHITYTNSKGTAYDSSVYQWTTEAFSLHTKVSDEAIEWAREAAESYGVVLTGNKATWNGSAIACNGTLIIGTETKSVKVVKDWADGAEKHANDQILVYLTRDGKIVDADTRRDATVILNAGNDWSYTWNNLEPNHEWSFKEASISGYTSALGDEVRDFALISNQFFVRTLTNTPGADTHKLVITKTAYGLGDNASYKFTLKLDNVGDGAYALNIGGTLYPIYNNTVEFELKAGQTAFVDGLPKDFTYEVTEEEGNYNTYVFDSVTGLDSTITSVNVVNVSKVDITVEKKWEDEDNAINKRPTSITIDLMNGENVADTAEVKPDKDGIWTHTFVDLPEYDAQGKKIVYTVKEHDVDGYESKVDKWEITNILKRGSLEIKKVVVGGGDAAAKQEYTFTVTSDVKGFKPQTVTIQGEGSYKLDDLLPGHYTVTEDEESAKISGYNLTVAGSGVTAEVVGGGTAEVTVTNTYDRPNTPGGPNPTYTSLSAKKVWVGDDEANRPDSITVQLYRDGAAYGSAVRLSADNGWFYDWGNRLDDSYEWTVREVDVPDGYTSSAVVNGTEVTITNTYTQDIPDNPPPLVDVPDEEPPLISMPDEEPPLTEIPDEEPPLMEIPEEVVPLDSTPKTGDSSRTGFWAALCGLSLLGIALLGKKREGEEA